VEMLKRYREEINKDLYIDDFNIKDVQLKLPSRKHFWVGRLIDTKIELNNLFKQKKKLKKAIVTKIINDAPVKITTQTAEQAAESSEDIQRINDSIKEHELIIEYLEKVDKIFQNIHWEIKNIIEINKLEQL
jgi:hypothetical protein